MQTSVSSVCNFHSLNSSLTFETCYFSLACGLALFLYALKNSSSIHYFMLLSHILVSVIKKRHTHTHTGVCLFYIQKSEEMAWSQQIVEITNTSSGAAAEIKNMCGRISDRSPAEPPDGLRLRAHRSRRAQRRKWTFFRKAVKSSICSFWTFLYSSRSTR